MNTKTAFEYDEGHTSTEASSVATSTQSSASKLNLRGKFREVPAGIEILCDGIEVPEGIIVARNITVEQFMAVLESNAHLRNLWLLRGDLIYNEFVAHRVHNRLCDAFSNLIFLYNRDNLHQVRLKYDTDALVDYDDLTKKAGDVLITNRVRLDSAIPTPNVVGEVGYSSDLTRLTALAASYLNDSPDNHTELYFAIKLRYPYNLDNPTSFQMVFILYDKNHTPAPILVVSCGTLPLSPDVRAHLEQLTGISQVSHPDVHRGDGYGGPACTLANAAHPHFSVTFGGARLISINRDGDIPPTVTDPDLYNLEVSLYELQQVAAEALSDMARLNEGHTVQSQEEVQASLDAAAGGPVPVLTEAQIRDKADHLRI